MDINSKELPQSFWLSSRKRQATRLNSSSTQGDPEAGTKRFSRLIKNPRLAHESLAYRHRATRLAGLLAVLWSERSEDGWSLQLYHPAAETRLRR